MSSSLNTGSKAAAGQDADAEGYHKTLGNRQIQMIGVGGAIGVGLFLAAGGRIAAAIHTRFTLGFLTLVVALMGFTDGTAQIAFFAVPIVILTLIIGWHIVSKRQTPTKP